MAPVKQKLGIIGGAGPYASALLYQSIIKKHYEAEREQTPEIVLLNYPFTRGLSLKESQSHMQQLRLELQYCMNCLALQGVDRFAIACNTLHSFLPGLDLKGMNVLSIPQLVIETALKADLHKLLLLSTATTIQSRLYQHPSIRLVTPQAPEQKVLDAIIDRILAGVISKKDSEELSHLIHTCALRDGIDGIILGCTDLPVLHAHHPIDVGPLPILDSIQIPAHHFIHVERLV
ncbi:Asp/Glu/Hydantoin racemase family protein [Candidatus Protochlamydia naegleriophila]|uniref:Asp/Glu/Hydantoin racemase family protein n=1 Tax=Candidatus Protochlamydia naegleriophila TaxID=389348 RepID=A0A0U5JBM6_9BACT|nr:aspartate/glutamate racemase family protein [Candidatus Protochlamydia naegleriophila]CUI16509.1 Asp/Glu/Hydantoin racemase family protein [Candidatus Protochlamydia naegleriophila]